MIDLRNRTHVAWTIAIIFEILFFISTVIFFREEMKKEPSMSTVFAVIGVGIMFMILMIIDGKGD